MSRRSRPTALPCSKTANLAVLTPPAQPLVITEFDTFAARLCQALNVRFAKDAAALLGISPHAFAARRIRGSIPVALVYALAGARPDLKLDVPSIIGAAHNQPCKSAVAQQPDLAHHLAQIAQRLDGIETLLQRLSVVTP